MKVYTLGQAGSRLERLGWTPMQTAGDRTAAIMDFQRGWALGQKLAVDGIVGPATTQALEESMARLNAGKGTASAHFSFREFACKCGGQYDDCRRIWVPRQQIRNMEHYRSLIGGPVIIRSGCRCPRHNRAVGGASRSRHMNGDACDVDKVASARKVIALGVFGGVGYDKDSGLVRHVDNRPGSHGSPATWTY